jgi:integrase
VRLREQAGVTEATLHRFRHTAATYLVGRGKILKASSRLGHRDPSTTLRNYTDALPLDDQDAADELDRLYNPRDTDAPRRASRPGLIVAGSSR